MKFLGYTLADPTIPIPPPGPEMYERMGAFIEEATKAGVLLAGEGLQPTAKGKRVKFSGGTPTVIDGPFTESKELIAGFWLWQVKSMDEAIAWIQRAPKLGKRTYKRKCSKKNGNVFATGHNPGACVWRRNRYSPCRNELVTQWKCFTNLTSRP